jgi:hypothetical protein
VVLYEHLADFDGARNFDNLYWVFFFTPITDGAVTAGAEDPGDVAV